MQCVPKTTGNSYNMHMQNNVFFVTKISSLKTYSDRLQNILRQKFLDQSFRSNADDVHWTSFASSYVQNYLLLAGS